jgi:hypothetical protein
MILRAPSVLRQSWQSLALAFATFRVNVGPMKRCRKGGVWLRAEDVATGHKI